MTQSRSGTPNILFEDGLRYGPFELGILQSTADMDVESFATSTDGVSARLVLADLRRMCKNLLTTDRLKPTLPSNAERLKQQRDEAKQSQRIAEGRLTLLEQELKELKESGQRMQTEGQRITQELQETKAENDAYQQKITATEQQLKHEQDTTAALRNAAANTPGGTPSVTIPDPERFDGSRDKLRTFKAHLRLKLRGDAPRYPSPAHEINYTFGLLTGPAFTQVMSYIKPDRIDFATVDDLLNVLDIAFGDPDQTATAERKLETLKQANKEFAVYYAEFQRYAADVDWNEAAKRSALLRGLNNEIKDALMLIDNIPTGFNDFVTSVQRLDNRIRARAAEKQGRTAPRVTNPAPRPAPTPSTSSGTHPGPMDLSSYRRTLPIEERRKRIAEGRCLYCGGFGHVARDCPNKRPAPLRGNEAHTYPTPTPSTPQIPHVGPSVTPSLPAYSRPSSPSPKPAEN
jgi:hypothetical protein